MWSIVGMTTLVRYTINLLRRQPLAQLLLPNWLLTFPLIALHMNSTMHLQICSGCGFEFASGTSFCTTCSTFTSSSIWNLICWTPPAGLYKLIHLIVLEYWGSPFMPTFIISPTFSLKSVMVLLICGWLTCSGGKEVGQGICVCESLWRREIVNVRSASRKFNER